MERTHHQIKPVTGWILEIDETHYPAVGTFIVGTMVNGDTACLEFCCRRLEFPSTREFEPQHVVIRVAPEVTDVVVAVVAAQVGAIVVALTELESHRLSGETHSAGEIGSAQPDIANVDDLNHGSMIMPGSVGSSPQWTKAEFVASRRIPRTCVGAEIGVPRLLRQSEIDNITLGCAVGAAHIAPITPPNIELVQKSFAKVAPVAE